MPVNTILRLRYRRSIPLNLCAFSVQRQYLRYFYLQRPLVFRTDDGHVSLSEIQV